MAFRRGSLTFSIITLEFLLDMVAKKHSLVEVILEGEN